ncbi:MAG: hypothetical protein DCE90_18205 [Pseudanabaena sp.]|nr:MAG: hypothetical protein DCE90_18205 [Pseudanabaena sp.]
MKLTLREAYIKELIDINTYYFAVAKLYGLDELETLVIPSEFITVDEGYDVLNQPAFRKFMFAENEVRSFFHSIVNRVNHETMLEAFDNCGGIESYRKDKYDINSKWIDVTNEVINVLLSVAYKRAGIHPDKGDFNIDEFKPDYSSVYVPDDELYNEGDCDR